MDILVDVILRAGRSAIELSLFVLLPVMVVMLSLMRLLEARGALDWLVARLAPLLRPVGLTGLGVFAALQINFVSFAAPVATLAMMEQRGTSDRHLAATLAMVAIFAGKALVYGPNETGRLWGRYFEFFVPIIWLAAAPFISEFQRGGNSVYTYGKMSVV